MMRRILVLLTVALVVTARVLTSAMLAFAGASSNANCVGEAFSNTEPGPAGGIVSLNAQRGILGEEVRSAALSQPGEVDCSHV